MWFPVPFNCRKTILKNAVARAKSNSQIKNLDDYIFGNEHYKLIILKSTKRLYLQYLLSWMTLHVLYDDTSAEISGCCRVG